jgi:uncharacterized protein YacL
MRISLNFISRVIGMVVLAYVGLSIGRAFSSPEPNLTEQLATQLLALAGAGLGLLTTPRWTIELIENGLRALRAVSIAELSAVVFGALVGLVFGVLVSIPLAQLPVPFGQILPIVGSLLLAYLGATIFYSRRRDFGELLRTNRPSSLRLPEQFLGMRQAPRSFVVDTSAIIDGRIAAVVSTGFIDGTMLVPTFVLNELQQLADSADEVRRGRGKRGLDILNDMQKQAQVPVEVINIDVPSAQQVDDKLIVIARQYQSPIITNDHNLGRVAGLQGVKVLNLNQLADAVRPAVVPGQDMTVRVRDVGRERDQGISFMDDGTMIVIEDARRLVGQEVDVTVTRVFQTQTGRIVFAQLPQTGSAAPR